jgi:glycosyltransferase involved in cell wall biosynthesis
VRILLVSHPPLTAELGAAQTALNLAAALRARGHDAQAWSPEPLPPHRRWWDIWRLQRRALERFTAATGPFDVVDTPAISASGELARVARRLVVRSVQPELRYLAFDIRHDLAQRHSPGAFAHALVGARQAAAIIAGWRRAASIICLGSLELAWMRRRFPFWHAKLHAHVHIPGPAERVALVEVRRQRATMPCRQGVRFLWIGRWSAHKGTDRLLSFFAARTRCHPEDSLTLAGCGAAAEQQLSRDWVTGGRLRLVPSFSRAELPALLAAHDAGLFTSTVEGWGLSLNEMLESGLPVYATLAGGVADLRPFFPGALRPFPPPIDGEVEPAPPLDLAANGYEEVFSWGAISRAYERDVAAPAHPADD